jgi:hypothetical protein
MEMVTPSVYAHVSQIDKVVGYRGRSVAFRPEDRS